MDIQGLDISHYCKIFTIERGTSLEQPTIIQRVCVYNSIYATLQVGSVVISS